MDATTIANELSDRRRGSFFSVTIRKDCKTFKGTEDRVEKESIIQGQLTDYSSRRPVREAVEAGERDAPELPSHIAESFTLGGVRFWRGHNGAIYFPIPAVGKGHAPRWFLNGAEVDLETVKPMLLASELPKSTPSKEELEDKGQVKFFGVNVENIIEVR